MTLQTKAPSFSENPSTSTSSNKPPPPISAISSASMKTLNINNNDDDDNDATLVAHHKIVEFEIAVQPIHPYPVPITASMRQATMANTQSSSSTFASSRTTCKLLRNGAEGISRSRKRKSDNDKKEKESDEEYAKTPSSSGNFCLTSTPSNKASTSTVAVTAMEDLFQMEHSSQPTNTNEIEAQSSSRTLNKNTPKTQPNMPHEKPRITPMIFEHFFFR